MKVADTLGRLASRPVLLFTVLWAVSALSTPYENLSHDAKLYGLLVLNQLSEGGFSEDLFLRFGSQDQFSPFSRIVAPLARLFGIEGSFLVLFLVFNALLVLAMQKLVSSLIDDRVIATLALLIMAIAPLAYGGLQVFHVREAFFTPRVIACALGLLALDGVLRERYGYGVGLAVAATVAHPLMGFGVLLISTVCAATALLARRVAWATLAAGAACGFMVLGHQSLGLRLFGSMDAEWMSVVRAASAYNFPLDWTFGDWLNVAMSLSVTTVAGVLSLRESSSRSRFFLVTTGVAAIGLFATLLAIHFGYRLLLQGQPYRAVWILAAIEIPVALWLAKRAWQRGSTGQCVAAALVGFHAIVDYLRVELVLLLALCPVFAVLQRGLRVTPRRHDWMVRSLAGSVLLGALGWGLFKEVVAIARRPELLTAVTPIEYAWILGHVLGTVFWLGVVLAFLGFVLPRQAISRFLCVAASSVVLLVHVGGFAVLHSHLWDPRSRDVAFVRSYLERRGDTARRLTIYAPDWDRADYLWFDLHATSYYTLTQVVGVIFSRETALEAQRRSELVRSFELNRHGGTYGMPPENTKIMIRRLFKPGLAAPEVGPEDLRRVCAIDEGVDVVLLDRALDDSFSASNGALFVYECAHIRTARSGALRHREGSRA